MPVRRGTDRHVRTERRRRVDAEVVLAGLNRAAGVETGIGGLERRRQRRVGPGHAHRRAAAIDRLPRQETQLATGRRRQQQAAARRGVGVSAPDGTPEVDAARCRRHPQNRRVHGDAVAVDDGQRRLRQVGLRGGRRGVAARAQQVDRGRRGPQREPALAAAGGQGRARRLHRGVERAHPAGVGDAGQHQVAQRFQIDAGIARHQRDAAAGGRQGRRERVDRPRIQRVAFQAGLLQEVLAVQRAGAADGAGGDLDGAAQVGHHAVQIRLLAVGHVLRGVLGGVEIRIPRAAQAYRQVAAARQRQAAIGAHASGAAHGDGQALAARRPRAVYVRRARRHDAGIAARPQAEVAAAQGAEAGEADQIGLVAVGLGHAHRHRIGAEVDPPRRRQRVRALAPEPVADTGVGGLGAFGRAQSAPQVAADAAAHRDVQIAAVLRIPGAIAAIGGGVVAFLRPQQRHAFTAAGGVEHVLAARLVVGIDAIGAQQRGRRRARRVDAVGRRHAQVARRRQAQVRRARTHHAEHRRQQLGRHDVLDGRDFGLAHAGHQVADALHAFQHRRAFDLADNVVGGGSPHQRNALGIDHAQSRQDVAIADPVRIDRLAFRIAVVVGRVHHADAARRNLQARRAMRIGQHQRTARGRIDGARIGRTQVGAGRQLQAPAGRALRQHRRQGPVGALELARLGTQVDRLVSRQLDLGQGRDHGAARQRHDAAGRHGHRQRHALGPGQRRHQRLGAQHGAGAQLHARAERDVGGRHGAGAPGQRAIAVVHVGRQHHAGRQHIRAGQLGHDRQRHALGQGHAVGGQVVVQHRMPGEDRALVQRHAVDGNHHVAAERRGAVAQLGSPFDQIPALVVGRGRRRREAVVDAAVQGQVAGGANVQHARFAKAAARRIEPVGARPVAETGQVQVARHRQVAGGIDQRIADDVHPRPQPVAIQPGQPRAQRAVAQRGVDEGLAVAVDADQHVLRDQLRLAARDIGRVRQRRVGVFAEGVDRDGRGAAHPGRALHPQGHVVGAGAIAARPRAADPARVQVERAARHAVMALGLGAGAQVDGGRRPQGQRAVARGQRDQRAVGAVDDLAVAVAAQAGTMRIQRAQHGQVAIGGQADHARLEAAGIDAPRHGQIAPVNGDGDLPRAHFVAHRQVALLGLEAARAEHLALVQSRVQAGEVRQRLRPHGDLGAVVRHPRAARVILARRAAQDRTGQVHPAGGGAERRRRQRAAALVARRQVDDRAGRLLDVAGGALQHQVAAPGVAQLLVEADLAARQIQARLRAQAEVVARLDRELARGQHDGAVQVHRAGLQRQLGAQRARVGGLDRRAVRTPQRQRAAGRQRERGSGVAREQRRDDIQVAAAVGVALARLIRALPMIGLERAEPVGADAGAAQQVDAGEAQRQAVGRQPVQRLALGAVAEHDAFGGQLQAPVAQAVGDGRAGHAGVVLAGLAQRSGRDAGPHQVARTDHRRIAGAAIAVDGGRAQHQPAHALAAGGVERHGTEHVDGIARIQHQGLDHGDARPGIALEQPVEHALVHGQAAGQDALRGRLRQRRRIAQVQRRHRQQQVARAIARVVRQREDLVGGDQQRALAGQRGGGAGACPGAGADVDVAGALRAIGIGRQQVDPAVRHPQHAGHAGRVHQARTRIVGRLAAADGGDARALLHRDAAPGGAADQEHFGRAQRGARAQVDGIGGGLEGGEIVARPQRHGAADQHADRVEAVQRRRRQRRAAVARRRADAVRQQLDAGAADFQRAVRAALGGGEIRRAVEGQHGLAILRHAAAVAQAQRACIGRDLPAQAAAALRIGGDEGIVAHLVVAGVLAHLVARRQQQLARQRGAQAGIGHAQVAGRHQRPLRRRRGARRQGLGTQFDAIGAGHQRVGRRHQGVDARLQSARILRQRQGLAHLRLVAGGIRRHRRILAGIARHDGVDAVAGRAVAEHRIGVDQRRAQDVHRAAAAGDKSRAAQVAAAAQVQRRARVAGKRAAGELDAAGILLAHFQRLARVGIGQPVGGAAVGHHHARAADRGQAARHQFDRRGPRAVDVERILPQHDLAHRRADRAGLDHRVRAQAELAEHRQRRRGIRAGLPQDFQAPARRVAGPDGGAGARGRIQLRAGDAQVAHRAQFRRGIAGQAAAGLAAQQAHVAAAVEPHLIEAAPVDLHRGAVGHADCAQCAEADAVAHVDQVGAGGESADPGTGRRTVTPSHRGRHAIPPGARGARQPQVRRRQADRDIRRRAVGHRIAARIDAQALRGGQRHLAVETQDAVDQQRQVTEATRLELLDRQARRAMAQRRVGLAGRQVRRQSAGLGRLRQDQFAHAAHGIVDADRQREGRRLQRQRQRAAGRAGAAGGRAHLAIQEQPVGGLQHDLAVVAGQVTRAQPVTARGIDGDARAGGVQQRAGPDHDGEVARGGGGAAGVPVERAAQQNAAAGGRLAVAQALRVQRARRLAGHVQHGAAADPDGAVVRLGRGAVAPVAIRRHDVGLDAAAARPQRAVHRDAAVAPAQQADGAAGIDHHLRARADDDVGAVLDALRTQRQVRAGARRQARLDRIVLVFGRQPQFRQRGGVGARRPIAIDRRRHRQHRAGRDPQAAAAVDVVVRKAGPQHRGIQPQRAVGCGLARAADLHHAIALDRQRAAARHAVAAQLRVHRQRAIGRALDFRRAGPQAHVAALAAARRALLQQRAAGRHIDQRAAFQRDGMRRGQRHAAAVQAPQLRRRAFLAPQVDPAAAGVQHRAIAQHDGGRARRGQRPRLGARIRRHEGVAQADGAAARRQAGAHVDPAGGQRHPPAIGQGHRVRHRERARRGQVQPAQAARGQGGRVQPQRADARGIERVVRRHAGRDAAMAAQPHIGGVDVDAAQGAIAPGGQRARARHRQMALLVAIGRRLARPGLAHAVVDRGHDLAFQHRGRRRQQQLAGVAAHRVARLQARARRQQRVVEIARGALAPALVAVLVALVDAAVEHVGGRRGRLVQAAVGAAQPAQVDAAFGHVERAARQVDARPRLRHHFLAAQRDRAALRRPFADAVAQVAQVAAHFQQAAGRVPALALVAAGAGRHLDQRAAVDPHIAVEQLAGIAVARRVAQLIALHVDLDAVGLHRNARAHQAGHVQLGAVGDEAAARRAGRDLPAGGQRQRPALELDVTAADDLDARLVAPVRQARQVVEDAKGRALAQQVLLGRFLDQGAALAVERAAAVVIDQHRGHRLRPQHDAALRVGGGVEQMDGAARARGGGRQRHAFLAHLAARQRDVALGRGDQAGIAHQAAGRALARRDLVAARGRQGVVLGADAAPDDEAVAGRQLRLAARRGDGAGVVDLAARQQHVAAALRHAGRRVRVDARAGPHVDPAQRVGERGGRALRAIQAALAELLIADPAGRRHQVAHVDLAAAVEHHAVAVDQQHRALALDLPLDLAGTSGRIVDAVEHRPLGLLAEIHRGVAADVERLPVEDGAVRRLRHRDRGAPVRHAGDRRLRVEPAARQRLRVDLQSALDQPVRRRAAGGLARGRLRRLLGRDGGRGAVQVGQRMLQLLARLRLLPRRRRHARDAAIGRAAGGLRLRLRRALGREPAAAERGGRGLGAPRRQHQQQRRRHGLEPSAPGAGRRGTGQGELAGRRCHDGQS
ncbi:Uncharacterised protein [Achromobacter xylosoxidans]|nr:Uncharacterised protein [Achromobacter xylosoxidans]